VPVQACLDMTNYTQKGRGQDHVTQFLSFGDSFIFRAVGAMHIKFGVHINDSKCERAHEEVPQGGVFRVT